MLRLVVVDGMLLSPDPAAERPGRGAYLHLDPDCLDRAVRRRAFPRAFRLPGPLDARAVAAYLEAAVASRSSGSIDTEAGRTADERSMSTHR